MFPIPCVVSDTSPLISLEKITGGFSFARKLYKKIIIPNEVGKELGKGLNLTPELYLQHHSISDFVEIQNCTVNIALLGITHRKIHQGEAEAITLAHSLTLPLLIDEDRGTKVAELNGLQTLILISHLVKSYRLGIQEKQELIEKLDDLFIAKRLQESIYKALRISL